MRLQLEPAGFLLKALTSFANAWRLRRHRARAALQQALDPHVSKALEHAPVGLAMTSRDQRLVVVNDRLCEFLGYDRAKLLTLTWRQLAHPQDRQNSLEAFNEVMSGAVAEVRHIQRYRRKDGSYVRAQTTSRPVCDANGDIEHLVSTIVDLALHELDEQQAQHLTNHDPLTGLPNRRLLEQRLAEAIDTALATGRALAVLSLGLDRFKNINNSLGHSVGDVVLRRAAELLVQAVSAVATAARPGGDQFAVILPDSNAESAAAQADAILNSVSTTLEIDGHELCLRASVGIALFPDDGATVAALLASADAALHDAKRRSRNGYQFFTMQLKRAARARVSLEAELRRAIDRNELELHYQPKICLRTGEPVGAEALLRWQRATGTVPPSDFIPIAEDSGLIVPLSDWVIDAACRQLAQWRVCGVNVIPVAVNLPPTLLRLHELPAAIMAVARRYGVCVDLLEIEITESALMEDVDLAATTVRALSQSGVKVSIDDFGTGYSNLSQLHQLALTAIKIDRSLVSNVAGCSRNAAIVHATIDLAHALGLTVVAEGLETEAQLAKLRAARCDAAQGYLISKPLDATAFAAWIGTYQSSNSAAAPSPDVRQRSRRAS